MLFMGGCTMASSSAVRQRPGATLTWSEWYEEWYGGERSLMSSVSSRELPSPERRPQEPQEQPHAEVERRLDPVTFFGYALSAVPVAVRDVSINELLVLYYSQELGLDPVLASFANGFGNLVGAAVAPMVGLHSDRRTGGGGYGRRHPYLYLSIVPCALLMYLAWAPPSSLTATPPALATHLLVVGCLLYPDRDPNPDP